MSGIKTAEGISRREFLKAGVGFAAVVSGIETVKAEPVMYSQLSSNKIQDPREGCDVKRNLKRPMLGNGKRMIKKLPV